MVKFFRKGGKKNTNGRRGRFCGTGRTAPLPFISVQQQSAYIQANAPGLSKQDVRYLAVKRAAVLNFIASGAGQPIFPEPDDDVKDPIAYGRDYWTQIDSSPAAKATIYPMTTASAMLRGLDPVVTEYWRSHPNQKPMPTFANQHRKKTMVITTRGLSAASWAGRLASTIIGVWKSDKVKDDDIYQSMCSNAHANAGGGRLNCTYVNQDGLTKDNIDIGGAAQEDQTILDVRVASMDALDTLCYILAKRREAQPKDQLTIGCFTLPTRFILGEKHPPAERKHEDGRPPLDLSYHKAFQEMSKRYGVGFLAVMTTKGKFQNRIHRMWCIVATPNASFQQMKKMADGYFQLRRIKHNPRFRPPVQRLTMYYSNNDKTIVKDYPRSR
jgi:hypothetical protein